MFYYVVRSPYVIMSLEFEWSLSQRAVSQGTYQCPYSCTWYTDSRARELIETIDCKKKMDVMSVTSPGGLWAEPVIAILEARHSRIIENGQKGGRWVELVAETTPA